MTRPASACEPKAAPHQLATSPSEGAALGGKKRIFAKEQGSVRCDDGRASRWRARFSWGNGWPWSERRAAREVEDLGLVVLALGDRVRKVETDRTHRRGPDQAHSDRGADQVRVPNVRTARLGDEQRARRRAVDVVEEIREVRLPAIAEQVAGVGEHGA